MFKLSYLIIFILKIQFNSSQRSSVVLDNLDIKIEKDGDIFPEIFSVEIEKLGQKLTAKFKKESKYVPPTMSVQKNGKIEKLNLDKNHQTYREINGKGFATLILNKDGAKKFRMHGRIFTKGSTHFDVIALKGTHVLHKRRLKKQIEQDKSLDMSADYAPLPKDNVYRVIPENEKFRLRQRVFNGAPIIMDVETLVVADASIYQDHKRLLNSNNDAEIFQHIRDYYAHTMNGVNDKYQMSFSNDPDLRLSVKLVHVHIITNTIDAPWTNVSIVGEAGNEEYEGKEVIISSLALPEFSDYVLTLNLGIAFDHAVGVFNKDMWSSRVTESPETRTGVIGFAYVSSICSVDNSVSLVEDEGGFSNIYIIAHEIGHSLGASHDGNSNPCDPNDHFIMSAFLSYSNMANLQRFSSCSIDYFKDLLLVNNQQSSAAAQCLLNINNNLPSYVQNADISITGQLWNADTQCQMRLGPESFSCDTEGICSSRSCFSPSDSVCVGTGPAIDGTECDTDKVCVRGSCQAQQTTPVITSSKTTKILKCRVRPK